MPARLFTDINESFVCQNCGLQVLPSSKSCRNHCPRCLHSVHLDINPGDRAAGCGGIMIPVAVDYNPKKGYQIVHECQVCKTRTKNIAALEDTVQPDSLDALLQIMRRG